MITNLLIAALIAVQGFIGTGEVRRVSMYYPGEDHWGNLVADPACPNAPDASWGWGWCAVSPDLLSDYPFGTILFVSGEGLVAVHDVTATYIHNTVDLRVPRRRMECFKARVWVIFRQEKK